MTDQPPLFTPPSPAPGPHERAMAATLAAWLDRAHLDGDEHASTRQMLAAYARAADAAERDPRLTAARVAQILRGLSDVTAIHAPPAVRLVDPHGDALTARAEAILAETAQDAE